VETVLKSPTIKNYNSIKLKDLPELVKNIKSFDGEPTTKAGLEIALLTFLRTNEIRYATWDEIDFKNKLWVISAERMKMKRDHIVPMSKRVIEILKELQNITGQYKFIFASTHKPLKQPMSENAMLYALYRLGWHGRMTVHGFRHLASTSLNELGFGSHLIEKQLSHENKNTIAGTYNKAEYLNERITMMNEWTSFVENANGNIIPIHRKINNIDS
jgi:integrase